jgi:type I restriction-modification system DNA methylase subunit
MDVLQIQGDAFSEYFLHKILPHEAKLVSRLDESGAVRAWRGLNGLLRQAHRELRGSRQARVTRRVLLDPLAELLSWRLGELSVVVTSIGEEEESQPLYIDGEEKAVARVLAISAESSLDLPPEGLHRRFAPAHRLVRVLEQEGLTWGILLNAYELRIVRRSEGFVSSHLAFSLLDMADDVPGARSAWKLLWGVLRGDAWRPSPSMLDEVVRLGREHQQEVGTLLGSQVPAAVERLLQGAITHPANREMLANFVAESTRRRGLLEHLHAGALRYLYRLLFVLYAEARGLLPLDMPAYRDGYALTGARGLVRRALDRATDPRVNADAANGFYELSLIALFRLLRDGADLGPEGRIPAYGGGLFYPHRDPDCEYPEFDDLRIGDQTVAYVLEALTHVQTKRGKVTLSYRELDVEQLGSLYEGLLERAVDFVDEQSGPLWRIRLDGDVVLVTGSQLADLRKRRGEIGAATLDLEEPDEEDEPEDLEAEPDVETDEEADEEPVTTGKKKPIRVLPSMLEEPNPIPVGSVVLRPGLGRKQSGSYYTNRAFVEYLVRRAVDPLAEGKSPEEILKLSVCDPAMGSGHFLVGACRRLADHLLSAYRSSYAEERARAEAEAKEAYQHEMLVDAGVHAEVARVWTDEPAELAACRRLVAFYCLYGVDKNPLAVELARVSLWLATAASDHPLTFLNHRLVPGDSLLGITVDDLLRGIYRKKTKKALTGDEPHQGELALYFSRAELDARLQRAFRHLREIERLETEQPGDFEDQQMASLIMQQELAPFVDAHYLRIGRAFLEDDDPGADPMIPNRWMQEIQDQHTVSDETRLTAATAIDKGKKIRAFCWELTFPELFFEPDTEGDRIRKRERPGFDAMVGNPPWDKLEPKRKEFFTHYDPAIRDFQGQTLGRRIAQLAPVGSEAFRRWKSYESLESSYANLLINGGIYRYQVVPVNGKKTGGKPDLFKLFLERSHQLSRELGKVAVLLPAGLYALEGATGLRRMLFSETQVEAIYSFENWGKRFFPIHANFKFMTLAFQKKEAASQSFPVAFMLRDEGFLALSEEKRDADSVRITDDFLRLTNPSYLSIIELRDNKERDFVERIYRTVPPLSKRLDGFGAWDVEFHRELNMTDDAWRFRLPDWLNEHACRQEGNFFVAPSAEWYLSQCDEFIPGVRYIVPDGTKYRVTSIQPLGGEKRKSSRGQQMQTVLGFVLRSRANDDNEMPVIPDARYVPLYEGRMIHQFNHSFSGYVSGEGNSQKWRDVSIKEQKLVPHYYVEQPSQPLSLRAGYRRVNNQSNERTMLCAVVPEGHIAGDTVTIATLTGPPEGYLVLPALCNSFMVDFLLRQKIYATMNYFFVVTTPVFRPYYGQPEFERLAKFTARLSSITPEIQLADPALDLNERARLRAEIDAIVAGLYDLSPPEFAYILTTFPLLDRDQPPLPDDFFVRWNKQGRPKLEPRSYVTRDTALLAYFRHRGIVPPEDLAVWYRDEVKVNMINDEFCPFRMGPIRNLEQRVAEYSLLGAIAYIPSKAKKWDPIGPYQPRTEEVIA